MIRVVVTYTRTQPSTVAFGCIAHVNRDQAYIASNSLIACYSCNFDADVLESNAGDVKLEKVSGGT